MRLRASVHCALVVILAGAIPVPASARQVSARLHGSWAADYDVGIGGRVMLDLGGIVGGLEAAAGLDWFFPGSDLGVDLTYREVNADLIYRFGSDEGLTPYAGAGVNVARFGASTNALGAEISGEETMAGVNLLGGIRFRFHGIRPFIEGRLELDGGDQLVVTAGLRL